MTEPHCIPRTPRHARLFELIRQGRLAEQVAETRPAQQDAGAAHQPFMQTAKRSLSA